MGSVVPRLVTALRDAADLRRAVETGTYRGTGTRLLAAAFPQVVTIELSEELHRQASEALAGLPGVTVVRGDSAVELRALVRPDLPTLYFLDGHWSGGDTAGSGRQCPLLAELDAVGGGHADDCFVIDDARLFLGAVPPPLDPAQWPTLLDVIDHVRAARPGHRVTLAGDQIIAGPARAWPAMARYAAETLEPSRLSVIRDKLVARVRAARLAPAAPGS